MPPIAIGGIFGKSKVVYSSSRVAKQTMRSDITQDKERVFLDVYDRNANAVFRHCYIRVFSREKAQELTQEAFMRTWRYLANGNEVHNLRAFVFKIANNLIIDTSRKKKELSLERVLEEGGCEFGEDVHERIVDGVDAHSAAIAIDRLENPYREAVTMRFIEGLEPREIADILGETSNVISVRIHRGVQQLRIVLGYEK